MRASKLEAEMRSLVLTFLLGIFLQVRIDGRSVLLPFFAAWAAYLLSHLQDYEAFSDSPWFSLAMWSAVGVAVAGFVALVPSVDPFGPTVLAQLGTLLGSAGYMGALRDWCRRQGWDEPAEKADVAKAWNLACTAMVVVGTAAFVVLTDPRPLTAAERNDGGATLTLLDRPVHGIGWAIGSAAFLVVWIVTLFKMRTASKLVRHSLRAQPDAELVAA